MLPGGTDPLYRSVLAAAHQRYLRVEVWDGTQRIDTFYEGFLPPPGDVLRGTPEGGLTLLPGSGLTATLGSPVARNLTLNVPLDISIDDDLLAPYGNEIRAWYGVTLGDGSALYVWQVFAGKIQSDRENPDSGVRTVLAADYGQDVLDHDFVQPRNSDAGILIEQEFEQLVVDAKPGAVFGVHDLPPQPVLPLSWEFGRASAIDEMLTSAGALWWPLADGKFVARRYPWTIPAEPVITLTDRAGGVILKAARDRDRSTLYNTITATGERLNGDTPVYAIAADNANPASLTYTGGKFGIRSKLLRRQSPSTQGGAMSAAQAALKVGITPVIEWAWRQVPDASVELGDIDFLDLADGRTSVQVVTSFTLPFDAHTDMIVSGRSQVVSLVASGEV
jgi:hypothetical protein